MKDELLRNWKYYLSYAGALVAVVAVSLYGYFSRSPLTLAWALAYSAFFCLNVVYMTAVAIKKYEVPWLISFIGVLIAIFLPTLFIVGGIVWFIEIAQSMF